MKRVLGEERTYPLTRRRYIWVQRALYRASRRYPRLVRRALLADARRRLPKGFDVAAHFNPPYDPWDQRMCIVPDGDIYAAISSGAASVVTDHIDRFTPTGIRLRSGRVLEADIVVTATGLRMLPLGGIALSVDGADVELPERTVYKSMMLSGIPNFAFVFGYENASWTLKVDLVADHLCRLITYMDARGFDSVTPVRTTEDTERLPLFDLTSGYVQRGIGAFPHMSSRGPWTFEQAYEVDVKRLAGPVDAPELRFGTRISSAPPVLA
jgi:cation diffusion facilitator CzcD-associated flavoprotein CzcO